MYMRIILALLMVFMAATCFAQPGDQKVLVDKIVAVVGNKIILKSDIENDLADLQRQGVTLPPNAECFALEQKMGLKALVVQAEKDSLPVSDEEIEATIDNRIRNFIMQYGSKEELERVAGRTLFQLKEDMHGVFKDQKMAEAMRNKIVDNVKITPAEVQEYFQKIPADSLMFYESELEIGELIVYPKASVEADNYAISQLGEYKEQIEAGTRNMTALAQLYSDDPAAKQNAGLYQINRNQKDFDGTWLAKAFSLKEGQVSSPFKTRFGYHIIKLESRNGDDAMVRHILKIPVITSIELNKAKQSLDTARAKLITGAIDFGTAVNQYSNDETSKFTAGMRQGPSGTFLTIDQLDKNLIPVISNLGVGEFTQPLEFTDERDRKGVRIVYLKSKSQPHRENMMDDYDKIAAKALDEKKMGILEKWFDGKIESYYLKLDPSYRDCKVLQRWYDAAEKPKVTKYEAAIK